MELVEWEESSADGENMELLELLPKQKQNKKGTKRRWMKRRNKGITQL